MDAKNMLTEINNEISLLENAKQAITAVVNKGRAKITAINSHKPRVTIKKRVVSAEARKKISDAQKTRWANRRSATAAA